MAKNYRELIDLAKELERLQNSPKVKLAMAYKEAESLIRQKVEVFQELEDVGDRLLREGITLDYVEDLLGYPVLG